MDDRLNIIIDTREQTPWAFPQELAATKIAKLDQGDYALEGDGHFAIERKSLNDFLGTISSGWERFKRELMRMDKNEFVARVIIVEGDFESCCFGRTKDGNIREPQHDHPMLEPAFVCKRIAELSLKYGASILFATNPEYASGLALSMFRFRRSQIEDERSSQQ